MNLVAQGRVEENVMHIVEGRLDASGKRFGIVVSRTNELVSSRLLEGALDCLRRHGAADHDIEVVRVPGAFEAPQAAQALARTGRVDAMITLATLIRGETPHFDYLAGEVTRDTARVALESGIPGTFGVVTADSLEQATERAGGKQGNKGWQAALAAIELVRVIDTVATARVAASARVAAPAPPGRGRRKGARGSAS